MADWFTAHPLVAGVVTLLLMWCDWLLTVLQERERRAHHAGHYEIYPVNSAEGNPMIQAAVGRMRLADGKHLAVALVVSAVVAGMVGWAPRELRPAVLGYFWGLFLIVITTHTGNLIGYRASRRGIEGMLRMHQRTGYVIQMGRYAALAGLLVVLAICSGSLFMAGVAVAGVTSSVRQLVWMRRIPAFVQEDVATVLKSGEGERQSRASGGTDQDPSGRKIANVG
jgi:hypothetical protein